MPKKGIYRRVYSPGLVLTNIEHSNATKFESFSASLRKSSPQTSCVKLKVNRHLWHTGHWQNIYRKMYLKVFGLRRKHKMDQLPGHARQIPFKVYRVVGRTGESKDDNGDGRV